MLDSSHRPARRFSRRGIVGLGLVSGAALALSACGQSASAPAQSPATGTQSQAKPVAAPKLAENLTFAHTSTQPAFDPHYSLSNSGFLMVRQIYDALVTFDESGKVIPQLATEWKRIDNTTMEFKLRDDVKFANGEPFTADVVKWNVNRLMESKNPNHSGTKNRMGPLADAEVVNANTVRIKTKTADAVLLNRLVSLFFASPKHAAEGGDDGMVKQGIGTAPYKGAEIVPGQRLVFEAWDGSWRGRPSIKQAKSLQFNDESAMIAAFRTGEVDIIFRLEADQVEPLKAQYNIATQSAGSATSASLIQQNGAPYQDKRVRQALNMAVNKDEFVSKLLGGYGDVLQGQLAEKGMTGYQESIKAIPYDPDRAKALLREAGVTGLKGTVGTSINTRSITEGLAGYLQAIGVDMKINVYESAVHTRNVNTKTDDPLYVYNRDFFHFKDYDIFGGNLAIQEQRHFDNEEFKKLYLSSVSELDPEKRGLILKQMAELLNSEAGLVFLFVRQIIKPYSKKITKLPTHFDTATYFWEVEKQA